jgi:amino acid adenylation domain-containing protein
VEVQAARTPDAVAIVSDSTTLTYAELNARANQLAHHLRRLSVGPEARVAICLDRGAHLVMALLAVLKANGAFVPLDPTYPAERLAWMLADSNACVLVTDATMRAHVPVRGDLVVVDLDDRAVLLAAESVTNPTSNVGPAHAAYVIYTSGSTGQPHAVVVPHGGVTNLMMTPPTLFGIEATSRVLQWASASFDAAVWEVFRTLTVGATLLAPSRYAVLPGATLVETLRRAQVSVALFPPSVLAFTDAQELPALLTVVSAGEALATDVAARWSDGRTVINAYGPTETTVCATLGVYGREPGAPPIGRPLANVRVYVLDADGQPVPVGLAGELYIGGVGVARGYLHHPGLTAARFVPDPFAAVSGRLYRTGDRVRWRADGVLEYLGRLDAQVKIRGHRIEPGEIETVLARQRGVREARVVVREDTPGHKRLVAYVVGDAVGNTLRAQLQNHLPGYMVPAAVVVLSRLPLTVNGKLDVRALPRPASDDSDSKIEQPKSFVEAQLIHIWEELLGVEVRTPTQSFFDLGGDSFLAVQLLERIKQRLHCDLPVTTLFTGATVRQMANAIAKRQQSGPHAPSPVALLQPSGSHPPLFCVHAASGKAIVYIDLVRHLGADRPIFGLEDLGDPSRPVTQVASEYVDAIQSVRPDGPYYLAGWSFGGVVAYEMASLLERQGHTISFVGLIDTWEPALEQRMATDEVDVLIGLGRELAHLARQEFSIARADLEPLDEEQRISRLLSALHARGILLRAGPKAIRDLYELPRARAASTRGCTLGQLSAVVTLFRTTKNNRVDLEPIFAGLEAGEKWTLGWSRVSSRVNVHTVAGEHDTMCQEPYVRVLAQRMRQVLAEADHRVTA